MILSTHQNYTALDFFITFIVISIFGYWYFLSFKIQNRKTDKFAFIDEILLLTAYIINIDGNQSSKEKTFIKRFLIKEYDEKTALKYIQMLDPLLIKKKPIKPALERLNYNENESTLVHLLNFLIKITVVDGFLSLSEYKGLLIICQGLGLRRLRLDSMLAMYNYVFEGEQQNKQKSKFNKSTKNNTKLKQAFTILELKQTATTTEIKKSYRKLVVLYHPDKLGHLDDKFKKGAKEKFQKINDAYDYLKDVKGFK